MRFRTVALLLPAVTLAAACGERSRSDSAGGATAPARELSYVPSPERDASAAAPVPASLGLASARQTAKSVPPAADGARMTADDAIDPGRVTSADVADSARRAAPDMVIRTGRASIEVDSLGVAVARVRELATRVGGVIANSSLQSGRDQVRSATLEIRVTAPRFDELVAGLTPFGKVETVNVTAEEVGEEFVDLSARVANARRLEARLVGLLATRTGKLADVLTVERELARVREAIERYEGRLRYLQARAAVSTLAVTVHEPLPLLAGQPATNPIAQAFVDAWRNFVALTATLIAALGVLVPIAAIAGLGWVAWGKMRRRRVEA